MKNGLATITIAALAITLSACGGEKDDGKDEGSSLTAKLVESCSTEPVDWNYQGWGDQESCECANKHLADVTSKSFAKDYLEAAEDGEEAFDQLSTTDDWDTYIEDPWDINEDVNRSAAVRYFKDCWDEEISVDVIEDGFFDDADPVEELLPGDY